MGTGAGEFVRAVQATKPSQAAASSAPDHPSPGIHLRGRAPGPAWIPLAASSC